MPIAETKGARAKTQKRPRGKQSLELGYESDSEGNNYDSEEEEEDDELITKPQLGDDISEKEKEKEDDDDDMFASEEDEEKKDVIKVAKPKGFDMDQFEREQGLGKYDLEQDSGMNANPDGPNRSQTGNIETQHYRGNIDDLDGSEERPQHGNEVQLEAFNLREEAETGTFDKDMNYTKRENSDDENEEDAWLMGIKGTEIRKAREAQLKLDERKVTPLQSILTTEELLENLIGLLEPAETPMEALVRLSPKKSRKSKKNEDDQERKKMVFSITEFCESLSNEKGIYTVYDMSREELMRSYYSQTGREYQTRGIKRGIDEIEDNDVKPAEQNADEGTLENEYGEKIWEYRWIDSRDDVLGLFSSYEMKFWKETYFNNSVEVRLTGTNEFKPISDVEFNE